MKKIYRYLLISVALLAFDPIVGAQNTINDVCKDPKTGAAPEFPNDNGTYTVGSNVGYKKQISKPQSDGTYWIKLEAFATGSATVVQNSVPSDAVLVLDLSSSMSSAYRYDPKPSSQYTYGNYPGGLFFKHTDGKYYEVQRGGNNNQRYLRYEVSNNNYWYLNGSGSQQGQVTFANNATIYDGVLYDDVSRLQALKEACIDFVNDIYQNAAEPVR